MNGPAYGPFAYAATLPAMNAISSDAMLNAGWYEGPTYIEAATAALVDVAVQTLHLGDAVSRRLYMEQFGRVREIGETDGSGESALQVSVRRRNSFQFFASDSWAVETIFEGQLLAVGQRVLPPSFNGYSYRCTEAGAAVDLDEVTFAGSTIVFSSGAELEPVPLVPHAESLRYDVNRHGTELSFTLDTAESGGPGVGDDVALAGTTRVLDPATNTEQVRPHMEVYAFERYGSIDFHFLGAVVSDTAGEFTLTSNRYHGGDVLMIASDRPGRRWQASLPLSVGDIIRPTTFDGVLYRVTVAGNTGATEPTWWDFTDEGAYGSIGTATAVAIEYFEPIAHGPIRPPVS